MTLMTLNQSDLKKIGQIIDKSLNSALKNHPTNDNFNKAIETIKKDIRATKESIDNLNDLSKRGFGSLLPWTDEIHNTIVKENLPTRIKDLESIHPHNRHSSN